MGLADHLIAHVLQCAGFFHGDVAIRNFLWDAEKKIFGLCDFGYASELAKPAEFWAGDLLHGSNDQIMGRKATSLTDMQSLAYSALSLSSIALPWAGAAARGEHFSVSHSSSLS